MKISIIVPTYNEESTILKFQETLRPLNGKCEIIFVDGGSTDSTVDLIDPAYTVLHTGKGRACQMNTGAKYSSGDVLFFLHCDSEMPSTALEEIEMVMQRYQFGYFGIAFHSESLLMSCCQFMSNRRAKIRRIVFGDQGIFLTRKLFFLAGGFPEVPIMEDYIFSLDLRRRKVKVGMTKSRIYTSDRRYSDTNAGRLKTMAQMHYLRAAYRHGMPLEEVARRYRDIR